MYLHLGNNVLINEKEIVGIFDLDNVTLTKRGRDFINKAQKENRVIFEGYDLPKSFVVCSKKDKKNQIYLSVLSSNTLLKRSERKEITIE